MSVFAAAPDVLHFYSYATGVSIELPVGFTVDDEDATSATYVDEDSDPPARVQVRVVGEYEGDASEHVRGLVDGFAEAGDEVVSRRDLVVDQAPASTVLTRRADGWLMHQTALADDAHLLTVVGMIPPDRADQLPRDLDTAIESIRLVRL